MRTLSVKLAQKHRWMAQTPVKDNQAYTLRCVKYISSFIWSLPDVRAKRIYLLDVSWHQKLFPTV